MNFDELYDKIQIKNEVETTRNYNPNLKGNEVIFECLIQDLYKIQFKELILRYATLPKNYESHSNKIFIIEDYPKVLPEFYDIEQLLNNMDQTNHASKEWIKSKCELLYKEFGNIIGCKVQRYSGDIVHNNFELPHFSISLDLAFTPINGN